MSSAQKFLVFVAGLVLAVAFIGAGFATYNNSNDTYKQSTQQISNLNSEFTDADKSIYDGVTETGSAVIRVISKFWEDDTVEVLVCTVDGKDLIYSKRAYDMAVGNAASGSYVTPTLVSGLPATDCNGKSFDSESSDKVDLKIAVSTAYSGGYNKSLTAATAGYISDTASFEGSVQRDQNGTIRRITFVQQ